MVQNRDKKFSKMFWKTEVAQILSIYQIRPTFSYYLIKLEYKNFKNAHFFDKNHKFMPLIWKK